MSSSSPRQKDNSSEPNPPYPPLDQEFLDSVFSDDEDVNGDFHSYPCTLLPSEVEAIHNRFGLPPPPARGDVNFVGGRFGFFDHYPPPSTASTPSPALLGPIGYRPPWFPQGVLLSSQPNQTPLLYPNGSSSSSGSNNGCNLFLHTPEYPPPGHGVSASSSNNGCHNLFLHTPEYPPPGHGVSASSSNKGGHNLFLHTPEYPPPGHGVSSSSSNNAHNLFLHTPEYPPPGHGTSYGGETSRRPRSPPPVDIDRDYLPVGPRGCDLHGRGTASLRHDYKEMKRVIERGNLRETRYLIDEIKHRLHELMIDRGGNDVIRRLFKRCHENFISDLLLHVINREDMFVEVCVNELGQRAIVELLNRLTIRRQQSPAASIIGRNSITLGMNFNGHEVLRRCLERFPREDNELILLEIAQGCLELANDQAGVCVLQMCIDYAEDRVREALVTPLIRHAELLSRHVYGNYVIQFMVQFDEANMGVRIIRQLTNKFVELSTDKFASNVVEKCLMCGEVVANFIVFQINSEQWLHIFTNEYGNYVAQRALSMAQGRAYRYLVGEVRKYWLVLHRHPHGRSVIGAIRRVRNNPRSPER